MMKTRIYYILMMTMALGATITCHSQTITGNIYGGGSLSQVVGNTTVTIANGSVNKINEDSGDVYGGGLGTTAIVTGNTTVNINGGTVSKDVYGGGALANVSDNTFVNINGGTVSKDVYGGGALADVGGSTTVTLAGGSIVNAYGGGLGNNEDAAIVTGSTTVTLGKNIGTEESPEYSASVINGGIFGCNNVNGTPQGQVFVHVLNTAPRDGQGEGEYDVPAVYGGGNQAAYVPTNPNDSAVVLIENCESSINRVFGGGDAAAVKATYVTIMGGVINQVFAGGNGEETEANVEKNTNLFLYGGTINDAFGGSNTNGTIGGEINVTVDKYADACPMNIENVYGGGNVAASKAGKINILCTGDEGKGIGNVFGGANMADITSDITLNIKGGKIGNVFGGNNNGGTINGAITVDIDWATGDDACGINSIGNVYGGGNLAAYTTPGEKVGPTVNIVNGTINNVFGGGLGTTAVVTGNPVVNMTGGTVNQDIYGGGDAAAVVGTTTVQVNAGSATDVYGGGNAASVSSTNVVIDGGTITGDIFGGGHGNKGDSSAEPAIPAVAADVNGNANVTVHGGVINRVFAGGNQLGEITGSATLTVEKTGTNPLHITEAYGGGNVARGNAGVVHIICTGNEDTNIIDNVFGGANNADITSDITLNIEGGHIGNVYGGNNNGGNISGAVMVNIDQTSECGLNKIENVFGAGRKATYVGNPVVNMKAGTVTGDVYGGGALANVDGYTTVNLTGGSVGGAFGGGLGQKAAAAVGTEGEEDYIPAQEAIAAIVTGNTTVTLNGSQVTDKGIFGCNNVNGTPQGHALVHVLSTVARDGKPYHATAVYGGGNQAAYEPTNPNDFAEVLIENCDNSIEYVYGGGNAAPVPATKVTIFGANSIGNAFAGGNGEGEGNPGADIGYLGYFSTGSRTEYGTGEAYLLIYGGTVKNAYGGSNTLGYIRTRTTVELADKPNDYTGELCDLNVGEIHGGGNKAEMYCDGSVILGCTEGADVIFAGSKDSDIEGDLSITITSGTYGKVFGGNDSGGCVKGKVQVNIDETGCFPVMIGELYCCGNEAPYSVYGYNEDKSPKVSGEKLYDDPEVNIISCTRIDNIFGGGNGSGATVYGSPTVNINTIKGIFAGEKNILPLFILNDDGTRKFNGSPIDIPDETGLIGNVYGGGNEAQVFGNTCVNIGIKATNNHISGSDVKTLKPVEVNIMGNVFGGSKGKEGIENANAGKVTGTTKVFIGDLDLRTPASGLK